MKGIMLRLPDEVMDGLKQRAGKGQINAVLTRLVKEWLGIPIPGRLPEKKISPDIKAMISSVHERYQPKGEEVIPEVVGCINCGEPAKERKVRGQVVWMCDGCFSS